MDSPLVSRDNDWLCGPCVSSSTIRRSFDDLCAHFRRAGFAADPIDEDLVEVDRLDAPTPDQATAEIRVHLQLWRILYPDQRAELVPS